MTTEPPQPSPRERPDGQGERERLYLLRLAPEIATKSRRTRSQFLKRLAANIRDATAQVDPDAVLEPEWSRMFVRSRSKEALSTLVRVFGLSSVSAVEAVVPPALDRIVEEGHRLYGERVTGKRYAVRARRRGRHAFSSQDIHVELGAALNPYGTVHLDDPEVRVEVEVLEDRALLYSQRNAAPGGLPLGVEGRALALISGGYDSAVAAALMLKRGVELDYVFCNLGGEAYERAVLQVAKVLADDWSYGTRPRLFALDFGEAVQALRTRVKPNYVQVLLKRLMCRVGSRLAEGLEAEALITGEALGQVSSQTLKNLRAIEPAASVPVFRPLIGFDKQQIIARARELGTASLSEKVKEYCALVPEKPVTAASVEAVDREEGKLNLSLVDRAVEGARVHDLRSLTPTDLVAPYLFITEIPENAVVLDCRPAEQYRHWHLPGAEHRDEWDLLRNFKTLDRDRTYVLYCGQGIQTAYVAERMQREGYEAYSFREGLRGILRYAREEGLVPRGMPAGS